MADIDLGVRLKQAREKVGLTQKEVCEKLKIPKTQTLSSYECGKNNVSMDVLKKLSKLYHISIDWLAFGETFLHDEFETTSETIANLFLAAYKLGLPVAAEEAWTGELTGEYVIQLKNNTLKGFKNLVKEVYDLNQARAIIGFDDYKMLVSKRILTHAEKSNNYETILEPEHIESVNDNEE